MAVSISRECARLGSSGELAVRVTDLRGRRRDVWTRYRPLSCASKHDRHGARAFLSALWSELALQDFDVSLIAGVAQLPEGVRAWALEALKGKEGAACPSTETYSATNKVPKYDYKGLHFKRNYPTACKTGKGKDGKTQPRAEHLGVNPPVVNPPVHVEQMQSTSL